MSVNFIACEKAFDSIHRDSLWQTLRAYGIPLALSISSNASNRTSHVASARGISFLKLKLVYGGDVSCRLCDSLLHRTVEDQRRCIRWTPQFLHSRPSTSQTIYIALLSHTWQHIQEKTVRLSIFSNRVGLTISLKKTEAMCVNVPSPIVIRVTGPGIPYTDKFTYLGRVLCQGGSTGVDIQNRLNKAE